VYPDCCDKPEVGQGLNKAARVTLHGCKPGPQANISSPRSRERYCQRVARMTEEKGAVLVHYDCDNGTWTFRVSHF
jgi:hypothetical protein